MEEMFLSYHRRPDGGRQKGQVLKVDLPESIGVGDDWRHALPDRAELLEARHYYERLTTGYEAVVFVMFALKRQNEQLQQALQAAQDQINTLAGCNQEGYSNE